MPTLSLTASPTTVASSASSTLTWSSTDATSCTASGAWSGSRATAGSADTGALMAASNTFTLTCSGAGGSTSRSATALVSAATTPAPTLSLTASPTSVASSASSTLTWSSTDATICKASGAWSGCHATAGSADTGALTAASNTFTLICSGAGGSTSRSAAVAVSGAVETGLLFPSNGEGSVRLRFTGANLVNFYPATYIWKIRPNQQSGYYTTFFWGQDDGKFGGYGYYGAHPYPKNPPGGAEHFWEVSANGNDVVVDDNGNDTTVVKGRWYTQALVARASGTSLVLSFYWDLDTSAGRVITYSVPGYLTPGPSPALSFGDAPWAANNELLSGTLRFISIHRTNMSLADIQSEIASPGSTTAGNGSIWYRNLNPTPTDISDKSGANHQPVWVGSLRPQLYMTP